MVLRIPSIPTRLTSWPWLMLLMALALQDHPPVPTAMSFAPSLSNNNSCRQQQQHSCSSAMMIANHVTTTSNRRLALQFSLELSSSSTSTSTTTTPKQIGFRLKPLFMAGPGRPRASAASVEEEEDEDDDDLEFEDDEEEDEEEEDDVYEEDMEIGNEEEDEEEDEIEFEYDEEELEEEEEFDEEGEEGEYYEEDGEVEQQVEEDVPATNADIWASYDAINEEPVVPLLEDVESDPHYQLAKDTILSQVEERKKLADIESKVPRNFESAESVTKTFDYIMNQMTDEEREELERDVDLEEVERIVSANKNVLLTEKDMKKFVIEDEDGEEMIDPQAIADAGSFDDDRGLDAFPSSSVEEDGENLVYPANGAFTEKDLVALDDKIAAYKASRERLANQTYFGEEHTMAYMDVEKDWPRLSNETQDEILDVIENSNTMACPEPEMWLMYDLNFNVTNLILASFRHNAEAPIMFTQWMPQLEVYERYADQRAKNFEWTWDDVEAADMSELQRYYKGIGYDHIPKKDPSETGVITLDTSPIDDEEREMLALENWMDEVYNEEADNLLFDDESFEPRDNVFDPDYGTSSSDKSSAIEEKFMKEYEAFEREFSEESQEWRDQFATVEKFEHRDDPEGQRDFRGHLVIACTPTDEDIDVAEKITMRFKEEFGKAVFVETRVLGHARVEDNVFEVWLESYEIDLLHSKRQAFINSKMWKGPSDVDDEQLEYLVERVRYLISDDARYSYRFDDYADIKA
eukprot:CAMPEP_0183709200 /NCGR_PEP_ID=MMETSP0737-20130205/5287_1 /TAXON_ID=385413 /ORGANISM="Thalassiosira miniscula, Strain CCMP1093" /LENGTH=748 /DNA_ID=CAMNT_0025937229 /DNA_START=256 /DNA_END=2502 /DNA_ORIENTATION=+